MTREEAINILEIDIKIMEVSTDKVVAQLIEAERMAIAALRGEQRCTD